jgi:hypothetical protein
MSNLSITTQSAATDTILDIDPNLFRGCAADCGLSSVGICRY